MKEKLAALSLVMFGTITMASVAPNQFDCQGKDISVTYSTSSFVGKPMFGVTSGTRSTNAMAAEIRVQDSEVGRLVTVNTAVVPDLKSETATLVVPAIQLDKMYGEQAFDTVVIETLSRTSIAGPAPLVGQIQSSVYHAVKCVAKSVVF